MTRTRRILVALVVSVAALVAGVTAFQWRQPSHGGTGVAGDGVELFYAQTLRDPDGHLQGLAAQRGKVTVINFWATWCVPCVQEIPEFARVNRAMRGRVSFVGLGIDSPDNIAAFDDRFKPGYPLLAAGAVGSELARAFGNASGGLPFTVVVDERGRVIGSHLGRVDEKTLRGWLAPWLQAGS